MAQRIETAQRPGIDDPAGDHAARQARDFLGLDVVAIFTRSVYKLAWDLPEGELEAVRAALTDPVLQQSAVGRLPLPPCDWVLAVGFRAGVTDNVGRTAAVFIADVVGHPLPADARVHTETLYLVQAPALDRAAAARLGAELLANELIQRVQLWSAAEYQEAPQDLWLPTPGDAAEPRAAAVPLPADPHALLQLSRQRTLSLSLAELQAIAAHYAAKPTRARREALGLPPDPTDVELEALAQTWSEHCKHKIFNAQIVYREGQAGPRQISSLFKTYIVQVTREIEQRVDWLVSVFDDNAGVVRISDDLCAVYKVETHNSPSALDPYGGAMTGIVGVNRDPLGTGAGAALLTNVWGYCLASPFYQDPIPEGLLHPRRIRAGVHQGVIDGGNQSGIPYSRGFELFDPRFLGKPLVFCGTVGLLPRELRGRPSHEKEVRPGDLVVMVGGRVGKDGIHGATFSSEALHSESPVQAVQIGDPITQKKLSDMLLEARDLGLYRTLTDNGAGGLSSSVGELAQLCNGAELDLERAPVKYQGLQPWEILLSEAQERMTLAVPPEQLEPLLALARRHEVEATAIGCFTASGSFRLRYAGQLVGELDMAFLHGGCPPLALEASWEAPQHPLPAEVGIDLAEVDVAEVLGKLVGRLNLCSRQGACRQYDHEVKGLSVIKPLVGVHGDVASDATVLRVRHGRDEALLLSEGIAPRLSDWDAGAMAAYVVDLAVRRIVAAGGQLGRIAGLDNFCWPDPVQSEENPDGAQKLGALVRACQGLARMTSGLDVPCISGKDSMKNDSLRGGVRISIPPTLLFSALGWIDNARRALDLVPQAAGEVIYILGETRAELGGSELWALLAEGQGDSRPLAGRAPAISALACRAVCQALQLATEQRLVRSAHALGPGGLGMGLALLSLASDLGCEVSLDRLPAPPELSPLELLYSESGSRFLLTVAMEDVQQLEQLLRDGAVPWARLGDVQSQPVLHITRAGHSLLLWDLEDLREHYVETLDGR